MFHLKHKYTICFDIDECTILGGDTYDILRLIAAMTTCGTLRGADRTKLEHMAKLLVNPSAVQACKDILERTHGNTEVVFYTQKWKVVDCVIKHPETDLAVKTPVAVNQGRTIYFAQRKTDEGYEYLSNQVPKAVHVETDRLGLVTHAAALAFGLDYLPGVYVTDGDKNLDVITDHQGVPPGNAFLFDDKAIEHATRLRGKASVTAFENMISVEHFTLTNIPEDTAKELQTYLECHFPMTGIKRKNWDLFSQVVADPTWPECKQAINKEEKWAVYKPHLLKGAAPPWDIQTILDRFQPPLGGAP